MADCAFAFEEERLPLVRLSDHIFAVFNQDRRKASWESFVQLLENLLPDAGQASFFLNGNRVFLPEFHEFFFCMVEFLLQFGVVFVDESPHEPIDGILRSADSRLMFNRVSDPPNIVDTDPAIDLPLSVRGTSHLTHPLLVRSSRYLGPSPT